MFSGWIWSVAIGNEYYSFYESPENVNLHIFVDEKLSSYRYVVNK